jgi:predicted enzyme related to lactoylglutathione lyase
LRSGEGDLHDATSRNETERPEVLGLSVDERFDTADFVLFDTNSVPFGLSAARIHLDEAPHPGWCVTLWIDCDDVDGLYATLEAKGATIIKPPSDGPFGRNFVFADPDGYRITANQNPWDRFPLGGRQER